MRLCIDPGHGGSDGGAEGRQPSRLREKDVNLAVGLALAHECERRGWEPLVTRLQDRTLSLGSRAAFANRLKADLFVSVHCNAAAAPTVEGMEVFHFPGSAEGRWLALHVLERLLVRFPGHQARGVKEADFAVLRRTRMPSILVECEFITCPKQLAFLAVPANQAALAEAIADGLAGAIGDPFQQMLPALRG
jgi:N-acetylmuramoyl-L-alanine amidase